MKLHREKLAVINSSLALLLGMLLCSPPADALNSGIDSEEYAVWRAVIEGLLEQEWQHETFKRIVIESQTSYPDYMEKSTRIVGEKWDIPESVINDFVQINKNRQQLENRFQVSIGINLLTEGLMRYFFVEHKLDFTGWDLFYRAYPNSQGLLVLSRVAFYETRKRALVYAGNQRHWLGGAGYLILLKCEGSEWKVERKAAIWIS